MCKFEDEQNRNMSFTQTLNKVTKPQNNSLLKNSKLSKDQIKLNHVSSEQKRRHLVRSMYDELVKVVPDLRESESRSELVIYLKTMNYLKWLYKRNALLRSKLIDMHEKRAKGQELKLSKDLIWELNKEEKSSSADFCHDATK